MFGNLLKTRLYSHQKRNLKFHLTLDRSAEFSEMGTGKSLIALAKVCHLIAKGEVESVLVACPKLAIPTWEMEIAEHTTLMCCVLSGTLKQKMQMLIDFPNTDIFILSYDSIPGREGTKNILLKALITYGFDMLICDEVTYLKNYETVRYRAIQRVLDRTKGVMFLTGTPTDGRPDTIFNIYLALDKGATFGPNYYAFRNKYYRNVGMVFPLWKIRETKIDELSHKMYLRAIRVRKDECLDLPPKIFAPRFCTMGEEQGQIYRKVANEILKSIEIEGNKVRIPNALVKLAKLAQICSGFVYSDRGVPVRLECAKLDALKNTLEEIGDEKVIIYTKYKEEVRIIAEYVKGLGEYRTLTGETVDRKEVIEAFQTDPKAKILIANLSVGGYALTLTAAAYIIYYSMDFSLINWLQSQDRIHRIGQTKTCVYIPLLTKKKIDSYIYETVQDKMDVAKAIVDAKFVERLKGYL